MNTKTIRGRPRTFDKAKALDIAMHIFWTHGYDGASVAHLAREMGINVPSLYAAFGNKEALYHQVLNRYGEVNGHMYMESMKLEKARDVAEAILMGEVELVTGDNTPDGCLVALGATITGPESENIRQVMVKVRATPIVWMTQRFKRAKKEGDLPAGADPLTLANWVMTLNIGIAAMAKDGLTRNQLKKIVATSMQAWPKA